MTGHYTMREAAKVLGVGRHSLRQWLKTAGYEIPKVPRGCKVLLPVDDVLRLLSCRTVSRRRPA